MAEGYDGSIRINTQIETKNVNSQMMKVVNSISKTEKEIENLRNKMKELETAKIPTQEYEQLQKELASAESKADSLYGKLRILEKTDASRTSASFLRLKEQIAEADDKIDVLRMDISDLESAGAAFTSGVDSEEYKKAADKVEELSNNLETSKRKLEELNEKAEKTPSKFSEIKDKAKSAFFAMTEGSRKSSKMFSNLASRTKGILLSLLIFNNVTKAFNSMVSGMKEGYNNLVQYSNEYNVAMSQLKSSNTQMKNSLATAFGPIVQTAIPHLITLINYVTEASNRVAQFTAVLSGKDTWTKAVAVQEDYAESLNGITSAAKKAKGVLASFDTLEVLNKKDTSSGGINPKDMFEEVPIEDTAVSNLATRFKEMINAEDWEGIGTLLSNKFKDVLDGIDWQATYQKAHNFGSGFAQFLNGLIEPDTFGAVGKTIAGALNTAISAALGFAEDFDFYEFGVSIATGINEFFEEFDAEQLAETLNKWVDGIKETIAGFLDTITWEKIKEKTTTFLGNLELDTIAVIIGAILIKKILKTKILGSALSFVGSSIASSIGTATTEAITTAGGISGLLTTDMAVLIGEGGWKAAGLLAGGAVIGGIIAAITGWNLGQWLYEQITGEDIELSFKEQMKEIFDSFSDESWKDAFKLWGKEIKDAANILVEEILGEDLARISIYDIFESFADGSWKGAFELWGKDIKDAANLLVEEILGDDLSKLTTENLGKWWDENVTPWFTAEKWNELAQGIFDGLSSKWDEVKEWWNGTALATWWEEDVAPWFTLEKWEETAQGIEDGISTKWDETVEYWKTETQKWWDNHVAPWFTVEKWKTLGENMKKGMYNGFYGIVSKTVSIMNGIITSSENMINFLIDKINEFVQKFTSGFADGISMLTGKDISFGRIEHVKFDRITMPEMPALADGAVIRGGNPFAAILGDQPRGQTNVETPVSTIEEAVLRGMQQYGGGGRLTINVQMEGETLARVFMDDWIAEANRRGLDVDLLGGLT